MKSRHAVGVIAIVLGVWGAWLVRPPGYNDPEPHDSRTMPADTRRQQATTLVESTPATSCESGEKQSRAIAWLVAAAKTNEQLTPADIQSLLVFVSSPKPGALTDGEWEERVNVILNLLRRQTEDSRREDVETEDRRRKEASSLAGSGAGHGVTAAATGMSAVPGLTEVLLEMAERNRSKVLRLYAMQHLSLWFGKERDPGKRRAMVGLLEKLATTPGDETAGCAVLMLADMRRRETEDFETEDRRQEGASALAGSGAGAGLGRDGRSGISQEPIQNPSAETSATSASLRFVSTDDGIDWARVDGILETASRRLVGEAGAGVDVRISAVHACVDRKDAGALPDLRKVAADPALVSTLRKAAIHAIGQLGTAEDMALLDSLPQDDLNLSQALTPAKVALATRTKAAR